jgi:uncharacterized protein
MTQAFADTSFYVAIVNPRDALHTAATELAERFRGAILTTEYVLIEVGNWLARSGDRRVFVELMKEIRTDHRTLVLASSSTLFQRGLDHYARRPDKNWSLTDCISFMVMQEHGLTDALTADHHFQQAGFRALLLD